MTESVNSYIAARDARVKRAVKVFASTYARGLYVLMEQSAERGICLCLGIVALFPFAMIWNTSFGMTTGIIGLVLFVVFSRFLFVSGKQCDRIFAWAFTKVDRENPRFAMAMKQYQDGRVHEKWSSDTI